MIGREVCNCLAEQFAITPKIHIYEILTRQFCSFYNPLSNSGSRFLTAKELSFIIKDWPTFFEIFLIY